MAEDVKISDANSGLYLEKKCGQAQKNTSCQGSAENMRPKNNTPPEDKTYGEIRGNERHILFHFFTLFSISFVCGILLIHLSLWLNSYIHTLTTHVRSYGIKDNSDIFTEENLYGLTQHMQTEVYYSTVYTEDDTLQEAFLSPFYYTGNYFNMVKRNVTGDAYTKYFKVNNHSMEPK